MEREGVAYVLVFLGAFLLLVGVFAGLTGFATFHNVSVRNASGDVDGHIMQRDNFTIVASVNNTEEERSGNLLAYIWDNTGGIFWSGILSLISGENTSNEVWEVNVSSLSPPFPNVTDIEVFDYSVNMTLSGGINVSAIGNLTVVSESVIPLDEGWNLISFTMNNSEETPTDRNITLNTGWNLVGYSSDYINVTIRDNITIEGVDFDDAVEENVIHNQFSYYDSGSEKYQLAPFQDSQLKTHKGYWVYLNSSEAVNLTLEGAGGTLEGETFPVSDLIFRNESSGEEVGIMDAYSNGWFSGCIRYWQEGEDIPDFSNICVPFIGNLEPWRGYFIETTSDDLVIIRRDYGK
jgi:hypothetical protein